MNLSSTSTSPISSSFLQSPFETSFQHGNVSFKNHPLHPSQSTTSTITSESETSFFPNQWTSHSQSNLTSTITSPKSQPPSFHPYHHSYHHSHHHHTPTSLLQAQNAHLLNELLLPEDDEEIGGSADDEELRKKVVQELVITNHIPNIKKEADDEETQRIGEAVVEMTQEDDDEVKNMSCSSFPLHNSFEEEVTETQLQTFKTPKINFNYTNSIPCNSQVSFLRPYESSCLEVIRKVHLIFAENPVFGIPIVGFADNLLTVFNNQEYLIQDMVAFTKSISGFQALSPADQTAVFKRAFPDILLLRSAYFFHFDKNAFLARIVSFFKSIYNVL